ncbi:protein-disulfide isomerase [Microbacterium sp. Gd 4-13]|uniref:DsbA family protein n=1 Tax=Microbacterium sp. Gd 4-13 TaxID=2173179 RepID=UPI000D585DBE|nr:thioredoxin domain-containing protein [Microbacterium sp. Gd 4-13]PVW04847.1 protein-disulfide isomerase [Microbacterium sp. Gd 4-13]
MSHDESPNVPAKRDRREAVREKAQQVQTKQSRLRILRGVLIGVAALVVVGGTAFGVAWALDSTASTPQAQPENASQDGFTVSDITAVGGGDGSIADATPVPEPTDAAVEGEAAPTTTPTAAPAVDIRVYVDYLSAGAREFQLANRSQLSQWVSSDTASLTYYPVAMLTAKSNGTKYSLRAASAAACVATHSPERFFDFNNELLRAQPEIDTDGHSDSELADLAQGSSVTDPTTVRSCIENEEFAAWAKAATDRALKGLPDTEGLTLDSMPKVLVNGTPYVGKLSDPKEFQQFVFAVASDAYFRTATPTPTPTATPAETAAPAQTAAPEETATAAP